MGTINHYFVINKDAEITLEANPDDLSEAFLLSLRQLGFNRLSIGTQSFNDDDLKRINRRHSAQQAIDAIARAQQAGFNNISADLIFALPFQTIEAWQSNLTQLFKLDVQHISCYNLIYEEGTAFYDKLQSGEYKEIGDKESLQMYKMLIEQAKENGFMQYETSNFAKQGLHSKHNSNYWTGAAYLGVGAGAHSYDGKARQWNISSNKAYMEGINTAMPNREVEDIDEQIAYNEFIMTGLRTMWGCDLNVLKTKFGDKMLDYCMNSAQTHLKANDLQLQDNILTITPQAIFISDAIMSDLMMVD